MLAGANFGRSGALGAEPRRPCGDTFVARASPEKKGAKRRTLSNVILVASRTNERQQALTKEEDVGATDHLNYRTEDDLRRVRWRMITSQGTEKPIRIPMPTAMFPTIPQECHLGGYKSP